MLTVRKQNITPLSNQKTILSRNNALYLLENIELPQSIQETLKTCHLYKDFENLVGYVSEGSTINEIRFQKLFDDKFLEEKGFGEGTIVQTIIAGQKVLYQIIDAQTREEGLEHQDSHGYTVGTAQKLGIYNLDSNELKTVKWLPEMYVPVFLLNPEEIEYVAENFIGHLPNTSYGIPIKNPEELVTHNTAILGILGIGKSCLTFELLQKLISTTNVKIICIDLTNQYAKQLPEYISSNLIQSQLPQTFYNSLQANNRDNGNSSNPTTWGNQEFYKTSLSTELANFFNSDKRVIILNPDWHNVSKAGSNFNITHKLDLSPAEKTRVITERIFLNARELGETTRARYLLVFEESHSLVPEWNSVSNDGDKNATNGTAKVILQGRKFGLGSMVVAQRTANISKSILNQCNTIFAMRIFDDTGKQFLENYIGSNYSNLLPLLEERYCIASGKAMKLKQPIIIELNDMNDVKLSDPD